MKKIIILITFLLFSFNFFAQQNNTEILIKKNHLFKSNLLGLFTLFYEHPVSNSTSLQLGLQYNPETLPVKDKLITSIAPELRFYFKGRDRFPSGFFIAPYVKYQYLIDRKGNTQIPGQSIFADIQTFAIGGNTGYQMIFKNNLIIELFVGAGYNVVKDISTDFLNDFPDENYNFDLRFGLGLGYAF